MKRLFGLVPLLILVLHYRGFSQPTPPKPIGPLPTQNQLHWQKMEYYAFSYFSINTYTDMAWGLGNEDPKLFNPNQLVAGNGHGFANSWV